MPVNHVIFTIEISYDGPWDVVLDELAKQLAPYDAELVSKLFDPPNVVKYRFTKTLHIYDKLLNREPQEP